MSKTLPVKSAKLQGNLKVARRRSSIFKGNDDCWCVLQDNKLHCYKNGKMKAKPDTLIDMDDVQTIRPSGEFKFEIVTGRKKIYEFNVSSPKEREQWISCLNTSKIRRSRLLSLTESDPSRNNAFTLAPSPTSPTSMSDSPTSPVWTPTDKSPPVFQPDEPSGKTSSALRIHCISIDNLSDGEDNAESLPPDVVEMTRFGGPESPDKSCDSNIIKHHINQLATNEYSHDTSRSEKSEEREDNAVNSVKTDRRSCSNQDKICDNELSNSSAVKDSHIAASQPSVKPKILAPKPKLDIQCAKDPQTNPSKPDSKSTEISYQTELSPNDRIREQGSGNDLSSQVSFRDGNETPQKNI